MCRCFLLSLVIVVPVAFLWINGRAFLLACGQQDAVASLAGEYLTYLVPGLFCSLVRHKHLVTWPHSRSKRSPD